MGAWMGMVCDLSAICLFNFGFVLQVLVTTVRPLFIHFIRCMFGLSDFDRMSEVRERK